MSIAGRIGNEILVNTTTAGQQRDAAITPLATGGFVVMWVDESQSGGDTSGHAIRAQVFNVDGSKSGAEFLVNTTTSQHQSLPSVTALANGGFVAAWSDSSLSTGDGSGEAVRAQIFGADGTKSGAEFIVPVTVTAAQTEPAIAALPNGGFVAVWSDFSGVGDIHPSSVRAQVFDADGDRVGPEFRVNTTLPNPQWQPSIAVFPDGHFVVAWTDLSGTGGDSSPAIRAQVFNADGTLRGGEFLVNTTTVGVQQTPSIAVSADGHFAIAWTDTSQGAGDIRAQVFNPDGSRSGAEFAVNSTTGLLQQDVALTALPDGRFVAAWTDGSASVGDVSGAAIRAQVFNADGTLSGGEFLVNTTTASAQSRPTVTTLADGRFVVAWEDMSQTGGDTTGSAIRAQVFMMGEPPVITSNGGGDSAAISLNENQWPFFAIAATDPDSPTLTYSIAGGADATHFFIDPATGLMSFWTPPNHEVPTDADHNNTYQVVVRASDGAFHDDQAITFTVQNVNEQPSLPFSDLQTFAAENSTSVITTVQGSDPEGAPLTYSISGGADAAHFAVDAATGALSFVAATDFESPDDADHNNSYAVTVRVSDGSLFNEANINVVVVNANEAPTIADPDFFVVQENGTTVATVAATDPEGGAITYSIVPAVDSALFQIDPVSGALSFITAPDFEAPTDLDGDNLYHVRVRASDGSLFTERGIVVAVSNANDQAPVIASNGGGATTTISRLENEAPVTTVFATDADGNPITYSIAGGADASLFQINPTTGALSFITAPEFDTPADADHNNSYVVGVRASDGSLSDTQSITVNLVGNVPRYGNEFLVNTTTELSQREPAVAGLTNGRFVVTWTDSSGDDTTGADIRGQVFNADGSKAGSEFVVNTRVTSDQFEPAITALTNGRFLVAWRDASSPPGDEGGYAVVGRIFNPDGSPAGAQFIIPGVTANDQDMPAITAMPNGRFVAVWYDAEADGNLNPGIHLQGFDANGSPSGPQLHVNTTTAGYQAHPVVTALANGGFVVAWEDGSAEADESGHPEDGFDIRAQVFNADGTTATEEFVVNTQTVAHQTAPTITTLADGGFVIAWTDDSGSGGDPHGDSIRAQRFNADGSRSGGEFVVNTQTDFDQNQPAITALPDGRFAAVWTDSGVEDEGATDIQIIVFNQDGTVWQGQTVVNTTRTDNQLDPTVTALADGRVAVAWTDDNGDGSFSAIRGAIFDPRAVAINLPGTTGHDDFIGTGFNDTLNGGAGNDQLEGGGGNDILDGGAGTDHAVFSGPSSAYTIVPVAGGFQVTGPDGVDTLIGFEFAVFDDLTIPLAAAAQPPVIGSNGGGATAMIALSENTQVATDVNASDPDNDVLTYTIVGGADAARFTINADNGVLSFVSAPDFEAPADADHNNSYAVTVRVSDGTLFDEQAITVNVTNANEAPRVATPIADLVRPVNGLLNVSFASTFADLDSALTYTATLANGAPLPASIVIDIAGRALTGKPPQNFIGGLDITVTASDGQFAVADTFHLTVSNAGNDVLVSGNGAGTTGVGDIFPMIGGPGNDTYVVSDDMATIPEEAGTGIDTIYTNVTYTMPAHVEGMVLQEAAGAIGGSGNAGPNTIIGNSFANRLNGGLGSDALVGGGGDDVLNGGGDADGLAGGTGNDMYVVDSTWDHLLENPGEGVDVVYASAHFALVDNVEHLVLIEGAGAVNGTGNSGANTIIGNSFANTLQGGLGTDALGGGGGDDILIGGGGADGLAGGTGNDTYHVDNAWDQLLENPGEGTDVVYAGADFALFDNVENLFLREDAGAINGTGNSGANTIVGNSFANTINAGAGNDIIFGGDGNDRLFGAAGVDTMTGGAGNDLFYYTSGAVGQMNGDTITDFQSVAGQNTGDSVVIRAGYSGIAFNNGSTAITYNGITETLYHPGVTLSLANDFLVV